MDKDSQTCGLCSIAYNTTNRIPRILITCAHTLCSPCLVKIIDTPDSRKCPFDSLAFSEAQKSLENFPLNFALLALLEGQKQNICQTHGGEFTDICVQDKVKICSDCALFGEHKGHPIKKIKELKVKGIKVKKDLEEGLMNFEKNQSNKDQGVKKLKNICMGQLGHKFGEINKILKVKQLEWRKQMESLFERNVDQSLLKEEVFKVIEEIDQALKNEEYLTLLDQDFNSIISRLQPQVSKEEVSRLSEQTSRMIGSLVSFLTNQAQSLKNFDLSLDIKEPEGNMIEEIPEQKQQQRQEHQQLSPANLVEAQQKSVIIKAKTILQLVGNKDHVFVTVRRHPFPIEIMVDFGEFNQMERVRVELENYDSLFQDLASLAFLCEIFHQLQNCTSLLVSLHSSGLTDDRALALLSRIFCRVQCLKQIEMDLGGCEISNEVMLFFCNDILPKASSLKSLTLRLGSRLITDRSLLALASSFSFLCKNLQSLTLEVWYTAITDDGIEKIFHLIEGVEVLEFNFEGTGITDRTLKTLGSNVMPCMKNLKRFSLDASKTKITIEGVNAIFTGIPMGMRWLCLSFQMVTLPDEFLSLFEEKVCPKLQLVEELHIQVEGKDLQGKMSKIKRTVINEAKKNRTALELNKEKNNC